MDANRKDQQFKLDAYILGVALGGGITNIDWDVSMSIEEVCNILVWVSQKDQNDVCTLNLKGNEEVMP